MAKDSPGMDLKSIGASVIAFGTRNQDLAIRIAVFTAVAHCCLGLLFVAGFQVYVILETFVRPLMWALLTGTFLFPFKSFLADLVKSWLNGLKTTSTPILVGIAWTPFLLIDRGLDYVGAEIVDFLRHHAHTIFYAVAAIVSYFVLYFWFAPYLGFLGTIFNFCLGITTALSTNKIWLIIIPYCVALHMFWRSGYRSFLMAAAIPLWILIGFYFYFLLDELAVPVYLFLAVTIAIGYSSSSSPPNPPAELPKQKITEDKYLNDFNVRRRVSLQLNQMTEYQKRRRLSSSGSDEERGMRSRTQSDGSRHEANSPSGSSLRIAEATIAEDEHISETVETAVRGPQYNPGLKNMLGDMLKDTYRNVTDVLKDESLSAHNTELEKADAEAIRRKLQEFGVGSDTAGTRYLSYVFWLFFLLEALTSFYIIPLIMLPVTYRVIKIVARRQHYRAKCSTALGPRLKEIRSWIDDRAEVLTPEIMKKIISYARIGDRKVLSGIEGVTDETVSAILICLMFVFAIIGGVIAMLQIEQETTYMVTVSGIMFDETFRNHPEYYEWLPEAEDFKEHLHTALDSAYVYSRDWAIKTIRSTIADTNETRVQEIEHDLTTITDRFYNYYILKNATEKMELVDPKKGLGLLGFKIGDPLHWFGSRNGTNETVTGASWTFDNIWENLNVEMLTEAITKYLDFSQIQLFVKTHIDTFMSVLESIWLILKGNITLIMTLMTTVGSVTITYFSAFLNFILCAVVYLTSLFTLLSSSGRRYKPIELVSAASKYYSGAETFAVIIEDSISGIFAVSLKLGTFYGFYTWVLFSFCGVYVKFIPSVLAAIFAVCPLVPSYVVALPAALHCWFLGDYVTLVILCAGAYLPKLFVDAAMYGDLKTANPYLFGLSVAGGLVTLGIEGAVVGPMVLCFFTIVMECYKLAIQSGFMNNDDSTAADNQFTRASNGEACPLNDNKRTQSASKLL